MWGGDGETNDSDPELKSRMEWLRIFYESFRAAFLESGNIISAGGRMREESKKERERETECERETPKNPCRFYSGLFETEM